MAELKSNWRPWLKRLRHKGWVNTSIRHDMKRKMEILWNKCLKKGQSQPCQTCSCEGQVKNVLERCINMSLMTAMSLRCRGSRCWQANTPWCYSWGWKGIQLSSLRVSDDHRLINLHRALKPNHDHPPYLTDPNSALSSLPKFTLCTFSQNKANAVIYTVQVHSITQLMYTKVILCIPCF